ncbi:MAG: N-acetyltransferase GCN5 [Rhodothermaceae bacterium]|nr:MAG: N-acetyltransferase GCN5 [Rhodothermaceae bacterium]
MTIPSDPPALSQEMPGAEAVRIVEAGLEAREVLVRLNRVIFGEERVINTFDRIDLMILLAYAGAEAVGFKVGYRENRFTFYSAKGGVLPAYRRRGIARLLLHEMMDRVRARGYTRFAYDTFPNMHPGMTILGLKEGFRVMRADYNPTYRDYRLRFEKRL